MKKSRIISIFLILIIMMVCTSCGKEEKKNMEPQITQMKSICELATMDCYYHNVAKYFEEDAEGVLLWKKDKHFWIEYSGVVRVGIDVSKLNIEVEDSLVTIILPEAKVLSSKVDASTLTKDSFYVEAGSAKITAEDETKAYEEAEANMEEAASNDAALLASARERAKILLTEYVNNIGEAIGKEYIIDWKDVNSDQLEELTEEENATETI